MVDGNGSELIFQNANAVKNDLGYSLGNLFTDAPTQYISPAGDFSTLEFVDEWDFTGFRRTLKDQTVYQFAETSVTTPSGETNVRYVLSSIEDRNGNKTTYLYNGQGILDAIVFSGAQTVDFVIEDGLITEIKTPGKRTTQLFHNSDGQLSQIVDPDGSSRSWSYLENNFIETETTKLGATYTYGYEAGRAAILNRSDSNQGRTEGQWTVQPVVTSGVRLNPNAELTEPNNAPPPIT